MRWASAAAAAALRSVRPLLIRGQRGLRAVGLRRPPAGGGGGVPAVAGHQARGATADLEGLGRPDLARAVVRCQFLRLSVLVTWSFFVEIVCFLIGARTSLDGLDSSSAATTANANDKAIITIVDLGPRLRLRRRAG